MTPEERHMIEFCLQAEHLIPWDRKFLLDLQKRKKCYLSFKQELYLRNLYLQHSNRTDI